MRNATEWESGRKSIHDVTLPPNKKKTTTLIHGEVASGRAEISNTSEPPDATGKCERRNNTRQLGQNGALVQILLLSLPRPHVRSTRQYFHVLAEASEIRRSCINPFNRLQHLVGKVDPARNILAWERA
eukprot:8535651-Pyramimonas_sp.AAC.1